MAAAVRLTAGAKAGQGSGGRQQEGGASLSQKIKYSLDEARILTLGAHVLEGALFSMAFQPMFEKAPTTVKGMLAGALGLMLIVLVLLLLPGPYHELSEHGEDTDSVRQFVSRVCGIALLPFTAAIGAILVSGLQPTVGMTAAAAVGGGGVAVALLFWYALEITTRHLKPQESRMDDKQEEEYKPAPLTAKIEQVLTELRVVLPGAQAVLGFQFISMFSQSFGQLPESSKLVHIGSLTAVALSTIWLMTPAAYHRLVENGEATQGFHRFASRMLLLAMAPLAVGLCGDFFVVLRKVTDQIVGSSVGAALMLVVFIGCWYGLTLALRQRHDRLHLTLARA